MSRRSKKQRFKKAAIAAGGGPTATASAHRLKPVALSGDVVKQESPPTSSAGKDWIPGLLLVAGVVLAYQSAWHAGFIWDDDVYVTNNPLLTAPGGLWRIWFSFDSPSQYFPLVYTTFLIEHALWGFWAAGYHWVNILLHGVNALLLWRLLVRLEIPGAWLAAAIFALHPVQVESVAWVTELKNVQMGFFFLLSLLAWTGFTRGGAERAWRFYALSLVFYALALLSKTTACTLPGALLLIAWLRGERIGWRRLLEVVPFLVLGVGMGLLTVWWERYHQGTQGKLFTMSLPERVLVASHAVWFYLGKLFWPAKLTFSYPRWRVSAADPLAYLWLLALCALGGLAWYARRLVGRSAEVALGYFVATLGPVLGFFMLYTFRYTFVADHYQYLACIGPIALLSAGMERLHQRSMKRHQLAVPACCALLLGILGVLTWRQSGTYRDAETLWRTTIIRNPESSLADNGLGMIQYLAGRTVEAIARYHEALRLDPDNWEAHINLGTALLQQGRTQEAVAEYREAIEINPTDPESHYNLGIALLRQGHTDEAISQYREALRLDPASVEARYNLGVALFQQGRAEEAIAEYREVLRLDPTLSAAHLNLGMALFRQGRTEEAIAQYSKALQIDPANADAHSNLGNAMLQQGRTEEAIAEYREAFAINPADANDHYNLGNCLLRQGRTEEAIAQFREALRIDPAFADACGNLGIALFQQGRAEEAIAQFREALRIDPAYAEAHYNLGNLLLKDGQTAEAIAHIQKALELQPANPSIQNTLAWILATAPQASLRDGARAVQLATQASQSAGGNNPVVLRTLAAAYAEAGQFPNAVQTAQQALQLVKTPRGGGGDQTSAAGAQASNADLANALSREIKLYEAGQPFREGK